jgi:hypothetical protein
METGGPPSELPRVTVVAAFHRPALDLALGQIRSLQRQSGVALRLIGVIDGAETAADARLGALLEDGGFEVIVNREALGAALSFAAGLGRGLSQSGRDELFAYCDQDDLWHPEKLARSARRLRERQAQLVHCDARVVDDAGRVIARSLHAYESRQEPQDLLQHLLLNSVTGMTAVFTAQTAELALRLIRGSRSGLLHDHLTAIAAAILGEVVHLDEPLVDYVQHSGNQIGARPRRPVRWRRAVGLAALRAYRETSSRMFAERRDAARALDLEGLLPARIAALFVVQRSGAARVAAAYAAAVFSLLRARQYRRAMLCARMLDGALSRLSGGDDGG